MRTCVHVKYKQFYLRVHVLFACVHVHVCTRAVLILVAFAGQTIAFGAYRALIYNCLYIHVQTVKVTWPGARKKYTEAPKYC